MIRYYPNSNAKPRGSNLKAKVQTLVLWTFCKYLCGLTYVDTTIHTNIHNTHHTAITHTYTHLLINNDTYIHIYIYIYVYMYNYITHRSNTYLDINTNKEKFDL